jgi:lysophospholipase L1-like esterase
MNRPLRFALSFLLAGAAFAQTAPLAPAPAATPAVDPFWPADARFPVPGKTSSWTGFRNNNSQRRTLFAKRAELDRDSIVFVGDSITQGWRTLDADFTDLIVRLANRGIGGDTTPNLVHRLKEDVLALQPRGMVILIGTNDLGEKTPPEQIAANCRELHQRVRAAFPKIPIAWCLVMPRKGDDFLPHIRDLNARIVEFVRADANATVCDTFTPFAREDGSPKPEAFNPDLLHLNATGYGLWRDALKPIITGWKLGAK